MSNIAQSDLVRIISTWKIRKETAHAIEDEEAGALADNMLKIYTQLNGGAKYGQENKD